MRKNKIQSLRDLLHEYVKDMRIDKKLREVDVVNAWKEILGPVFNRYTRNIYFKNGTLFIEMNSSVARNELRMMNDQVIRTLNDEVGMEIVKKIVVR